jgi:hypothetical protein
MKEIKKYMVWLLSLGWVFFIPQTGYGEICNRVVALVNDDVITLFELNTRSGPGANKGSGRKEIHRNAPADS